MKNKNIISNLKEKYLIPSEVLCDVTPENIQNYITKALFSAVVNTLDLRSRGYYNPLEITVENAKKSEYYDKDVSVKEFMPNLINNLLK